MSCFLVPSTFPIVSPRPQCPLGRMSRAWDARWPDALTVVATLEDLSRDMGGLGCCVH